MSKDEINDDIGEKENLNNNVDNENLEQTEGVSTILGDPKKAILKLSGPMIVAMLITSLYNLIDGIWVAELGQNALAAIGFIIPIFMVVMGFSMGLELVLQLLSHDLSEKVTKVSR